jgi:hypothetical protein
MLTTHPFAMGSLSRSMPTIGIVAVAFISASIAYGPAAKMTSQSRATSSLATSAMRSSMFPANRFSTMTF